MKSIRLLLGLSVGLVVSGGASCRSAAPSSSGASAVAAANRVTFTAAVSPDMGTHGHLVAIPLSTEEVSRGMHKDPNGILDLLGRVQVTRDVVVTNGVVRVEVTALPRPSHVMLVLDTANQGLEAVLGARSGVASAMVSLPADGPVGPVTLVGKPYAPRPEACVGERMELLTLDAPETRRPNDDGIRRLCVFLPPSYGSDLQRRYPVVLAFPGFNGWHASSDAWGVRGLAEQEAAARGLEVIYVGVGTRTAEGTSYLDTSARFGDWDAYLTKRVVPTLDQRYRTLPVRAALGHSTGGWNALAMGTRHPELVSVVGASSPDGPDLDAWLLNADGTFKQAWLGWLRAEAALGGPGQFVSYGAAWSPDDSALGFAWPVDLQTGAVRKEVYARWHARSLAADLRTEPGLARARALSGRILITAGKADEFGLYEPSERYAEALKAAGVEVQWVPTALGHFGHDDERWTPLLRFVMGALAAPRVEPR